MKSLSRRTVLRGMGVTLGLPLLDAMVPAFSVLAQAAARPVHRFQAIYVPNGMAMEHWTPAAEGSGFELTPILQPLEPFRDQLLVLSGLRSSWSYVHAGASGSFLTGTARGDAARPKFSRARRSIRCWRANSEADAAGLARSVDGQVRQRRPVHRRLELRLHADDLVADADDAAADGEQSTAVFERLFGDSGSAAPRRGWRVSVRARASSTRSPTSCPPQEHDRARRSDQVDRVHRSGARRRAAHHSRGAQSAAEPAALEEEPSGIPREFESHLELMFDLQLLALQSDLTRIVTFMMGREQSTRSYPQIGVPDAHHPLSNHDNVPERIAQMAKINAYHTRAAVGLSRQAAGDADGTARCWITSRCSMARVSRTARGTRARICRCFSWAAARDASRAGGI